MTNTWKWRRSPGGAGESRRGIRKAGLVAVIVLALLGTFWGSRPVMLASLGAILLIVGARARRYYTDRPETWIPAVVVAVLFFGAAFYELIRLTKGGA